MNVTSNETLTTSKFDLGFVNLRTKYIKELEESLKILTIEKDSLCTELKEAKDLFIIEKKELIVNLENCQKEKDILKGKIFEMTNDYASRTLKEQNTSEFLQIKVDSLTGDLEKCLVERDFLKDNIASLKNEIDAQNSKSEKDLMSLKTNIEDLTLQLEKMKKFKALLNDESERCNNEHLRVLAKLQESQSRIKTLEHELNKSTKCNDDLLGKFMKSENEYLSILKDLNRSNSTVRQLEQDLENSKYHTQFSSSSQPPSSKTLKYDKRKFKKIFVCHHCGVRGHIRPFCYQLMNNAERELQGRHFHERGQPYIGRPNKNSVALSPNTKCENVKTVWMPKDFKRPAAHAKFNSHHSSSNYFKSEYPKVTSSHKVPFHNTMKGKLEWKPRILNGIVDSSSTKGSLLLCPLSKVMLISPSLVLEERLEN